MQNSLCFKTQIQRLGERRWYWFAAISAVLRVRRGPSDMQSLLEISFESSPTVCWGRIFSRIVVPELEHRHIRFWDIPTRDCKSCLRDIEAATENQRLHSGISTVLETAETGQN